MLIDSNILVYAINKDSPKNNLAQAFLQNNIKDLAVAHQNIFETLRVLTHPKFAYPMKQLDAQEAVLSIVSVCRIIIPNYKTHHLALEFIKLHNLTGNRIFDAYLAATALSNNITAIATDNTKDFEKFKMTFINPFVKK
jgi:predicted nucleic acid-binding protein